MRRRDEAIIEFERAIALNPNFTGSQFGLALVFAGQAERAIGVLTTNIRVDPFQTPSCLAYLGHAFYMLGQCREAVAPLRECSSRIPNFRIGHLWRAATYAQLCQNGEALAEAGEVLRIEPSFSIDRWKCTAVYRNRADAENLIDGLRKAGLPVK